DDYSDILYWEKSAYLTNFRGGRGILQTTRTEDSGPLGYVVDEEGIIVTEQRQKQMRDKFRTLCFTLRKYGHAPTQWLKLDDVARRFYCNSMRADFPEFQLCSGSWKSMTFGSEYYSQW
ncbi:hypothetical protein P692DRAFT_20709725, partial [Suillus brevipes Sb2]